MMIESEQNNNDVTKFLGIPVDGSPESMRQKLIEKGFKFIDRRSDKWWNYSMINYELEGIFNNEKVVISIQKNKEKVWRIIVSHQNDYNKYEAIRKFNNLVKQFDIDTKGNYKRSADYCPSTYYIPNDVDYANFDINVKKQKYAAFYYQGNDKMKLVWFKIISKYKDSDKYHIRIYHDNLYNNAPQVIDVTKFLGIPVDGSPESMRQKLIEKGFKFIDGSDKWDPMVEGGRLTGIFNNGIFNKIFNNEQVSISIQKNQDTGKVWRIIVINKNGYSKYEAIRKFNNLVEQFDDDDYYTERGYSKDTYCITDDVDDVDFDRNVEKQKYKAGYYQKKSEWNEVWFIISKGENSDKYYIRIYHDNLYNKPQVIINVPLKINNRENHDDFHGYY